MTSGASGNGLIDYYISVYDRAGHLLVPYGTSDNDGHFMIGGLAPSTAGYLVCFSGAAHHVADDFEDGPFVGQCFNNVGWSG